MDKFSADVLVTELTWAAGRDPSFPVEAHIEENDDGSYSVVARNHKTDTTVRFHTLEEFGSMELDDKLSKLGA
jgi:hypothetical protein